MRILAIDDDPIALMTLEAALRSLGHQVQVAADADTAWHHLADRQVRVAVCDWRLPGRDGLELCRRMREERSDYVCFILLTQAAATIGNLEAAFAAGVDEFLTKPVNRIELRMRLHVAERILGFTAELQKLESFLPICGYCKKIRDDKNYWQQIEDYIAQRSGTRFSHGVCPHCYDAIVVPQLKKLGIVPPLHHDGPAS